MNILLVAPKEDKVQYESAIKSVSNANHLSTVSVVTEHFIDEIKERYNPHIIVWVCGVKMANNQSDLDTIKQIKDTYPYIRFIYFTNSEKSYNEAAEPLNKLGIYTIVARSITNIEFEELLKNPMKSLDEIIQFNEVKHRPVPVKKPRRKKNNFIIKNIRMFIPLIILVVVIIALFVYKGVNNISSNEEIATEPLTESVTESVSESTTEAATLYASPTEEETEKSTEKSTERETEKPTERQTERTIEKPTDKDESSSTTVNNNGGGASYQEQPVQYEQPVQQIQQEPVQQVEQPQVQVQTQPPQIQPTAPTVAQQSTISDDGQLHFDKESYTVKAGDTFDIYVSGLSASQGCKWSLSDSSIANFVSASTSKVTVKANGVGSTIITAVSKSNGTTKEVVVTVK